MKRGQSKAERAAYQREWYRNNRERALEIASKSGRKNRAKIRARQRVWEANNKEHVAQRAKEWATKNLDPIRERERKAAYKRANPGKTLFHTRKRQLAKLKRTPAWADQAAIKAIYEQAAVMRAAGFDVQVDHVIPLMGKLVSGLHVAGNLAIIERMANINKRNNFALDS